MSLKGKTKGISGAIMMFTGYAFFLYAIAILFGTLFNGKSFCSDFFDPETEEMTLSDYRLVAWTFIISFEIYFSLGGKMSETLVKKINMQSPSFSFVY